MSNEVLNSEIQDSKTEINSDKVYSDFLSAVREILPSDKSSDIESAFQMAEQLMSDLTRYSGEPMFYHAVGTASIALKEIGLGRRSVISALFHDAIRLELITPSEVGKLFGDKIEEILVGLDKISDVDPKVSVLQEDNFKELIVSYSTDPRIILLKLADRLEVMRSVGMFPESKRTKKSWETIHLYAPLAHKLGLYSIKSELEDLSLKYLEPESYNYIYRCLKESEEERKLFIADFVRPIASKLDSMNFSYKLKSRTKSIYSIWRKMKKQNVDFDGVFDIFAIRIIVDCPREMEKIQCWAAFSVVTDFYTPNPDRMRDWISIPKSNGYESLHTTVVTGEGKWVEVQIRSTRMDDIAEHGVAAHWRYKGVSDGENSSAAWLGRVREVVEASEGVMQTDSFDFTSSSSEVFVFTPKGDLRKLPSGATVLDFAFDIHTGIGSSCVGARVNGKAVSIQHKLKSGDIVEIKTSKNQKPKQGWLSYVVTSKARTRIQQVLRQIEAEQAQMGREELERKIRNWKLNISIEQAASALTKSLKIKTANELYGHISTGKVSMLQVKGLLSNCLSTPELETVKQSSKKKSSKDKPSQRNDLLEIDGYANGMDYKLAKCCNPVFGDEIFGFVTVTSGVTIHRKSCPNALRLKTNFPYRVLGAKWRQTDGKFLVTISFVADDRNGITNDIMDYTSSVLKMDVRKISVSAASGETKGEMVVETASSSQTDMLLANLKRIKGMRKVFRRS